MTGDAYNHNKKDSRVDFLCGLAATLFLACGLLILLLSGTFF
jgi:hypothetical protein